MSWLDRILDRSVVFSFDRTGFARHASRFVPTDLQISMHGKRVLITGASAGVGFATARALAAMGASVCMLSRNQERVERAMAALSRELPSADVTAFRLDVSSLASVERFVQAYRGPVDVLVHGAEIKPAQHRETDEGYEVAFATHVLGPHALTKLLMPKLVVAKGRVIAVSSSAMFTQKLDVERLTATSTHFDPSAALGHTKRALVVLSELWARNLADVTFSAMHPGWVEPAPAFETPTLTVPKVMLRSWAEGADCVVWLASATRLAGKSGFFWFDRAPVATHLVPLTHESEETRARLWSLCEAAVSKALGLQSAIEPPSSRNAGNPKHASS